MPSSPPPSDDKDDPNAELDEGFRPNYWFRRIVVAGGVVALIITAVIVITNLTAGSGGQATSGAISADWNRVVLIDERTGSVVLANDAGEEVGRIDTGIRSVLDSAIVGSNAVIVSANETSIVDLAAQTSSSVTIDADGITRPTGSALTTVVGETTGRRGLIIRSNEVIDTDTFAPIAGTRFQWGDSLADPSGRDLLVTDSGNFQSVLFSFDRDEPSYFPGLALAISDDLIVTTQNVGTQATVNVFDHDAEPISTATTSSVRSALIGGDTIQLITVDGEIVTMSPTSGNTDSIGQLELGQIGSGAATVAGDRIVVSGTDGSAIVDDRGAVIATYPDARITGPPEGSTCVVLADDNSDSVVVVGTSDATIVAESDVQEPSFASADGCTVASATPTGYQLMSEGIVSDVDIEDADSLLGLSPDATTVVVQIGSRIALVSGSDDPVDLGPRGRRVGFADL